MNERSHILSKEQDTSTDKVEKAVQALSGGDGERVLENFEAFRSYLAKRIQMAENLGFGDEQIAVIAQKVAAYLAEHEEPRNREEYLLRELWKVGDADERHKLAHLLVKLAKKTAS